MEAKGIAKNEGFSAITKRGINLDEMNQKYGKYGTAFGYSPDKLQKLVDVMKEKSSEDISKEPSADINKKYPRV